MLIDKLKMLAEDIYKAKHNLRGKEFHINSHKVIEEYHEWRVESESLFESFFDNSNSQLQRFSNFPTSGNGHVLMGYFTQQYPIFKVLIKKIENDGLVKSKLKQESDMQEVSLRPSIFISHSAKDKNIVRAFVDLILQGGLNLRTQEIFCSSADGMKIQSGKDWRESIKVNLEQAKIIFLIISPNYKESEVCLNEMGAAWVLCENVISLIIDPIDYNTVGILNEPSQAEKLLSKTDLSKIRDLVEELLDFPKGQVKSDRWTNKVDEFLKKVEEILATNPFPSSIDREIFNQKEDRIRKLTEDVQELKAKINDKDVLIGKLKSIKDPNLVSIKEKEMMDRSSVNKFSEKVLEIQKLFKSFSNFIKYEILRDFYDISRAQSFPALGRSGVQDAIDNKYIKLTEEGQVEIDWDSTKKMKNLRSSLDNLSDIVSNADQELISFFKEDYDGIPLEVDNMSFWKGVFK